MAKMILIEYLRPARPTLSQNKKYSEFIEILINRVPIIVLMENIINNSSFSVFLKRFLLRQFIVVICMKNDGKKHSFLSLWDIYSLNTYIEI